jgi:resuscitation-promoting factor RpfB
MTRYRYRRRGRMSGKEGALAVAAGVVLAATVAHTAVPALTSAAVPAVPANCATSAVACGEAMAAARGWTVSNGQFTCLNELWTRESGWNPDAANPYSSARGIPQDINGWADFAPGDVPNQVRWGLGYIAGRYITPCRAWNHETADGWY